MTNKTKQPKLTAIYADAEEKYIKNVVLYSNAAGEVFYDEALTQAVPATELQNFYLKGLVVFNTETQQYLTPTQFTVNGEEGTIDFGAPAGSGSGSEGSEPLFLAILTSDGVPYKVDDPRNLGDNYEFAQYTGDKEGITFAELCDKYSKSNIYVRYVSMSTMGLGMTADEYEIATLGLDTVSSTSNVITSYSKVSAMFVVDATDYKEITFVHKCFDTQSGEYVTSINGVGSCKASTIKVNL